MTEDLKGIFVFFSDKDSSKRVTLLKSFIELSIILLILNLHLFGCSVHIIYWTQLNFITFTTFLFQDIYLSAF